MAEPQYTVIGAGPVGTMLVTALAANQLPVAWIVRNPARRMQIAALQHHEDDAPMFGPEGCISIYAGPAAAFQPQPGWLILAVKAQQVNALLAELSGIPHERILVVANGLHHGPFILGEMYGGGRLDEDGRLQQCAKNRMHIGGLGVDPSVIGLLEQLARDLSAGSLTTVVTGDIRAEMWHKVALNCVINPLTALLDCENGNLLGMLASPLVRGVLAEVGSVMEQEGIRLPVGGLDTLATDLQQLIQATAGNSSSMREDLRAGRMTEVDQLNLAIAQVATAHGIACPLTEALGRMVSCFTNRGAL